MAAAHTCPGEWPLWRCDRRLTAHQPLPGAMATAPRVVAEAFLGATPGPALAVDLAGRGRPAERLVLAQARLHALAADGSPLWSAGPEGYWLQEVLDVADLDGDGRVEVLLMAGHLGAPCLALVVLDAASGQLRAAHPFVAGQFGYARFCGTFVPDTPGRQVVLVTSGFQDEHKGWTSHGHISLLAFEGERLRPRWDVEVGEHAIEYPAALVGPLRADGPRRVVVNSWCHVWNLDLASGRLLSHTTWDPQGANARHYGWNELTRVGGRAAVVTLSLTKHVDVLLADDDDRLRLAWTRGWPDPVTTEARSLACPGDPVADVDADGLEEVVVGLFDGVADSRWHLLALGGADGVTRAEAHDLVPLATVRLPGAGGAAVLCARCPTYARQHVASYELMAVRGGGWVRLWEADGPFLLDSVASTELLAVGFNGLDPRRAVTVDAGSDGLAGFCTGSPPAARAWGIDACGQVTPCPGRLPALPVPAGPSGPRQRARGVGYLLAADLRGAGRSQLLSWDGQTVREWALDGDRLEAGFVLASLEVPAVCPLLGDGVPCLVTGDRGSDGNLRVSAHRGTGGGLEELWCYTVPNSQGCGQYMQALFLAAGRFTGDPGWDVFVYTTKPGARACLLSGRTGQAVWQRDEIAHIERHFQPFGGRAGVFDLDGDGADDLLFCCPDYYCVADGRTGEWLVPPVFLPELTGRWSAYASPAVLLPTAAGRLSAGKVSADRGGGGAPLVYLGGAYESRASIGADGRGKHWCQFLPAPEWGLLVDPQQRFHEALLPPTPDRGWRVAQVQVDGTLACFDAQSGEPAWHVPVRAAPAPMISGDVDGDGRDEFLLAGHDGSLVALRDAGSRPETVWSVQLPGPAGPVVLADLNGDGRCEIAVATGDGRLVVLAPAAGERGGAG